MTRAKKVDNELKPDENGMVLVPKESVKDLIPEVPVIAKSTLQARVRRPMTDAQVIALKKAQESLAKKKADPEWQAEVLRRKEERKLAKAEEAKRQAEEEIARQKAEDQAKVDAGTHIRVKMSEMPQKKPKRVTSDPKKTQKRVPPPLPPRKPVETSDFTSDGESTSETEDTDVEEYKSKKRAVRKEVKKNLKALEKISEVEKFVAPTQSIHSNPYMSMLLNKWK